MKYILFALLSLSYIDSFSQNIPSDSTILQNIFGKTAKGGNTFSRDSVDLEIYSYQDSVVYSVVFKSEVNLDNNNLILVVVVAPYGTQHGHQFGYQDLYFLKVVEGKIDIVDSIKSERVGPIGDQSVFEIVDIGKNKKAIISTFQSTGNQHFENTKHIQLLELNKLTYLFSINAEYDNSCCKTAETDTDSCEAERYEETYEIVKSDLEWYDIKVHHIDFGFTNGCKDSFVKSETDKEYIYIEEKYTEISEAVNYIY